MKLMWEHSYVYQVPNGSNPLYWYAEVSYQNITSNPITLKCDGSVLVYGVTHGSLPRENMKGTQNSGYVTADETLCKINPTYIRIIEAQGKHYDWAIFHNVPWKIKGSLVSLIWGPYGQTTSEWGNPWSSPTSSTINSVQLPAPVECPQELFKLKTCLISATPSTNPGGDIPKGTAQNLIVLVHGCCTDETGVWEWRALADQIIGEILNSHPSQSWEVVVWDWSNDTPGIDFGAAYDNAYNQSLTLSLAIAHHTYNYIHLIGHSSGARLIDETGKRPVAYYNGKNDTGTFIHLTFLDAYRPKFDTYGLLHYPSQNYYAEHYVDKTIGLPFTNDNLPYALNFDITHWQPVNNNGLCDSMPSLRCLNEKTFFGHQWPRYWYEKSVTAHWINRGIPFTYGYQLSREGGTMSTNDDLHGECIKLLKVGQTGPC